MKAKKQAIIEITIIILVVVALIGVTFSYFEEIIKTNKEGYGDCAMAYTSVCEKCYNDCGEMGMRYFKGKASSGIFSSTTSECWCKSDGESKRIW